MRIKTAIKAPGLLSLVTFGATAAEQINRQEAQNLQPAGIITVSDVGGSHGLSCAAF